MALPTVALEVDLTAAAGATAQINGAIFTTTDTGSTGTGVIQSFVRVQANGTAEGYNTNARPLNYDENSSLQFTRDLALSFVPTVVIGGLTYREFLLDINQQGNNPLLSLDEVQIYGTATGGQTGDIGTFGSLLYDMDAGGGNTVLLDYSRNTGSGSGDLFLYVLDTAFAGQNFVTLYSMFGAKGGAYTENDGFEEWAVRTVQNVPAIPEPSTYALMLAGLGAIGFMARRRRNG